jgi:hypothetical protein
VSLPTLDRARRPSRADSNRQRWERRKLGVECRLGEHTPAHPDLGAAGSGPGACAFPHHPGLAGSKHEGLALKGAECQDSQIEQVGHSSFIWALRRRCATLRRRAANLGRGSRSPCPVSARVVRCSPGVAALRQTGGRRRVPPPSAWKAGHRRCW